MSTPKPAPAAPSLTAPRERSKQNSDEQQRRRAKFPLPHRAGLYPYLLRWTPWMRTERPATNSGAPFSTPRPDNVSPSPRGRGNSAGRGWMAEGVSVPGPVGSPRSRGRRVSTLSSKKDVGYAQPEGEREAERDGEEFSVINIRGRSYSCDSRLPENACHPAPLQS